MFSNKNVDCNSKSSQIDYDEINTLNIRKECITIGRLAPNFTALSTQGFISLSDFRGRWVMLTSHPMAFSPVSTTEIIQASRNHDEYIKRNVQYISLTTDNNFANLAWIYDIYRTTGVFVPFPIITDRNKEISDLYGMMNADGIYEESVRDAFIINPVGIIKAIITIPTSTGRGGSELLRLIDALKLKEDYNFYTPADWNPGDPVIMPAPNTTEELFERISTMDSLGYNCPSWYLCFNNLNDKMANKSDIDDNMISQ